MERKPYLYQHYTWPEMRDVIKSQPVVILPIDRSRTTAGICRSTPTIS
jgi:hypothetical protein